MTIGSGSAAPLEKRNSNTSASPFAFGGWPARMLLVAAQ
jgi:hypothetical protein